MLDAVSQELAKGIDLIAKKFGTWANDHLLNIFVIVLVGMLAHQFLTRVITGFIKQTVRHDLYPTEKERKKRIDTLSSLVRASVHVGVWAVAGMMIISELGINTGPLIASASVLGVALGFGAQALIRDFVSGIFIIVEDQYRIGDYVQLATMNTPLLKVSGKVEDITIRTTVLRDLSGQLYHVPNGVINVTINKSIEFSGISEDIVVSMDTDIDRLKHIVAHVGHEMAADPELSKVILEPPHINRVEGFDEKGMIVKLQAKTEAGEQWRVRTALYIQLQKAFEKHGIEVHGNSLKDSSKKKSKAKKASS